MRLRIVTNMKKYLSFPILFGIALIPRLLQLDTFLALDEFLWLERTRNFVFALQQNYWAQTFQTGHPGVMTMWSGSLGLWLYAWQHQLAEAAFQAELGRITWNYQPLTLIWYVRLTTVLITSLSVVGVYILLAQLYSQNSAFIGAFLLALDPWYLGNSRVLHHDALMSSFMLLSALALLVHVYQKPMTRRWLFLSGMGAGLALLSKTLSLFLLPWTGAVLLLALLHKRISITQALTTAILWVGSACMTFYIFWPSMWLAPMKSVQRVIHTLTVYGATPHERGQFFLGEMVADPGYLFYPFLLLYATTPLICLGIAILTLYAWPKDFLEKLQKNPQVQLLLLQIFYIVGYMLLISFGDKKHERYLLPAVLMLNCVAAVGIDWLQEWIKEYLTNRQNRNYWFGIAAFYCVIIIMHGAVTLSYQPYYFTYYNPLIHHFLPADQNLLIGRGEGNELAAAYFNALPNVTDISVTASFPETFAPFFKGQTLSWPLEEDEVLTDYAAFYRRDLQQNFPRSILREQVQSEWALVEVITIRDIPYVWLYRNPAKP